MDELIAETRRLVDDAAVAVEDGGTCGALGADERFLELLSGQGLLPDLCQRQRSSIATLRLWQGQLEQELARPTPDARRVETLTADIAEVAGDIVGEARANSYTYVARDYLAKLARMAVGAALTAADELTGALGPLGTFALLALAWWYLEEAR